MNISLIQTALRNLLVSANIVGARVVEGDAERKPAMPYIDLGEIDMVDRSGIGCEVKEITFTLHVWSDQRGKKQAQTIMAAMRAALEDQRPAVAGLRIVTIWVTAEQVFEDQDSVTRHGVMTVKVLASTP